MRTILFSLAACAGFAAVACQPGAQVDTRLAAIESQLSETQKRLDGAVARIDTAAKAVELAATKIKAPPRPRAAAGKPDPSAVYAVPVGDSAAKGSEAALVTIVESSEFQCPFCNRVQPTLKQLGDKYGDKVRVVFKHNPLSFHQNAMGAAKAAEAARAQGKFWEMHDLLFENQRALGDEAYRRFAGELGLDLAKFDAAMQDPATEKRIKADQALVNGLGARGTPAFWVNGRFLSGAQPLPAFEKLVDEELAKAEAATAKGTPAAKYYASVIEAKGRKKL